MNTNNTTNFNLNALTVAEKRDLVKQLRAAIKSDITMIKQYKAVQKAKKEEAKKDKLQNAIKAAQEKLAKLQAKLA